MSLLSWKQAICKICIDQCYSSLTNYQNNCCHCTIQERLISQLWICLHYYQMLVMLASQILL